jgi:mersacidin/lichenicidin family type 2 lantibiotic
MKPELIIRAWKDPEFRKSLTDAQREALPESPSGRSMGELSEAELLGITGGRLIKDGTLGPSTGCTGPIRPTCGIVLCKIAPEL